MAEHGLKIDKFDVMYKQGNNNLTDHFSQSTEEGNRKQPSPWFKSRSPFDFPLEEDDEPVSSIHANQQRLSSSTIEIIA